MFARRAAFVPRAVVAAAMPMSSLRFQGGGRGRGGGGMSDQQIRQMQQQQRGNMQQQGQPQGRGMQQQEQARRAPPAPPREEPPQEEEEEAPPAPTKPENSQFVKVEQRPDGIAVVKLARGPVNSLNLEFFTELADWFMWLSVEESGCKAVVLTSDIQSVFSAGLDINELHKPTPERFQQFWMSFQEMWLIINTYPKPVIAAINGNSPAGGCVLALCCDFRVMARASLKDPASPKAFRIGLNETKLGIVAPPWVMRSLTYVIGERKAEKMLQLGETPTADEALAMGLIDRVVEENEIAEAGIQEAARFMAIPAEARWMSKDMSRQGVTQFFKSDEERQYDAEFFGNLVQNPEVADSVGKYLARLGGGKK